MTSDQWHFIISEVLAANNTLRSYRLPTLPDNWTKLYSMQT